MRPHRAALLWGLWLVGALIDQTEYIDPEIEAEMGDDSISEDTVVIRSPGHPETDGSGYNAAINWHTDLASGLDAARSTERPALLLIHNPHCYQCAKLQSQFVQSKHSNQIVELSKSFVMINLHSAGEPEGTDAYRPDGEYIPRLLFLSPNGTVNAELNNTKGTSGYAYFYFRGDDVVREMKRAAQIYGEVSHD